MPPAASSVVAQGAVLRSIDRSDVWRPVQYLGSKLRSLDAIAEAVGEIVAPGRTVIDAFSGTSVVSRRLASMGARVTAVDTSGAAATWARALLGVGLPFGVTAHTHLSATLPRLLKVAEAERQVRARPWRREL